jgi:hypothetical protein
MYLVSFNYDVLMLYIVFIGNKYVVVNWIMITVNINTILYQVVEYFMVCVIYVITLNRNVVILLKLI